MVKIINVLQIILSIEDKNKLAKLNVQMPKNKVEKMIKSTHKHSERKKMMLITKYDLSLEANTAVLMVFRISWLGELNEFANYLKTILLKAN